MKSIIIDGKESHYLISENGDIFNKKFNRWLNPQASGTLRYKMCSIFIDGKRYRETVHRLVANAFLDNPENLPQINHIDGNKMNNHVDNLEWITGRDNITHQFETGISKGKAYRKIKVYDSNGNFLYVMPSLNQTAKKTGVNSGNISTYLKEGDFSKSIKGYKFKEVV